MDVELRRSLTCSPWAAVAEQRTALSTDYRADLRAITIPALVVHGRADVNAPFELTGAQTAELVPRAVPKVHETAAHGLYAAHADQLNTDLLEFIEGRRA
ncbi:alpha/beta fold hydrolase [Kutzneria kofuensis]|uniref:Pimeloyl-ACP methyl ester carboxylesterase n=1 Tax=Kutzneria kofuensis TaxID=103725 RepID=A0A7W9KQ48_9PSEU|nr:alpha/beta hydrolase [Kutzneria kofuensis]MBB5896651.1 pimeloyl-ACP methyl ester carboxylesterase [Kutzneria kofuensis]